MSSPEILPKSYDIFRIMCKIPVVSIITPCYNASATIAETIESVQSQTYSSWELLIIDDSSTDHSDEIIMKYATQDCRIRYFRTEHPSGSPALPRNIGIESARGKYIAFLDSDDIWLPDKLELQMNFMANNDYSVIYSYYEKINHLGERNNRIVKTRHKTTYRNLLKSNSIPLLTAVIARETIGQVRFRQIPQEDFCFWLDIFKHGHEAYNLPVVTALYRVVENSRSARKVSMFKGYWNVLRNYQNIGRLKTCYYSVTYALCGIIKYLK